MEPSQSFGSTPLMPQPGTFVVMNMSFRASFAAAARRGEALAHARLVAVIIRRVDVPKP